MTWQCPFVSDIKMLTRKLIKFAFGNTIHCQMRSGCHESTLRTPWTCSRCQHVICVSIHDVHTNDPDPPPLIRMSPPSTLLTHSEKRWLSISVDLTLTLRIPAFYSVIYRLLLISWVINPSASGLDGHATTCWYQSCCPC